MAAFSWFTNQPRTHSERSDTHPHQFHFVFVSHCTCTEFISFYLYYSSFCLPCSHPNFLWRFMCCRKRHNLIVIYSHSALQINKINVKRNYFTFGRRIPVWSIKTVPCHDFAGRKILQNEQKMIQWTCSSIALDRTGPDQSRTHTTTEAWVNSYKAEKRTHSILKWKTEISIQSHMQCVLMRTPL